jgi:CheY-like chemotaxis protein
MESSIKNELPDLIIFLVDDDRLTLDLYTKVLRREGFFTMAVSSAVDALEMVDRGLTKVNLIITDINMPGLNGVQFYEKIKERRPDLLQKIIFISGGTFSGEMADLLAEIPNPKLKKPFEIDELLNAVRLVSSAK